jgi:predicted DsbA family dithiol-disulfide isomerase
MSESEISTIPDPEALTIDVVSDVVCPWCFIGKRQLEQALQMRKEQYPDEPTPVVRWHPFQLNPGLPEQGMERTEYLKAKFGDESGGPGYDNIKKAAKTVGLELALENIKMQPNTVTAHSLVAVAQDQKQEAVVEALFDAYFMNGADLTQEQVIIELGRDSGIPEPMIEAALNDEAVKDTVQQADAQARELGVSGVPFFIFNKKLAVSGAAGAESLLSAIDQALSETDEDEDENEDPPAETPVH